MQNAECRPRLVRVARAITRYASLHVFASESCLHSEFCILNYVDTPSSWLVAHAHLLPQSGRALDVACGSGRHALWLAERGLNARAIDRDADLIEALNAEAMRRDLPLRAEVVDLESDTFQFTPHTYK